MLFGLFVTFSLGRVTELVVVVGFMFDLGVG